MRGNKGVFYCHFIATYCHTQKRSIRHDEEWHIDPFLGMLWFWGIILHGGICCVFLPDVREIIFIYQRIIGSLI